MFVMRNNCFKGGKSGQKASFSLQKPLFFTWEFERTHWNFPELRRGSSLRPKYVYVCVSNVWKRKQKKRSWERWTDPEVEGENS